MACLQDSDRQADGFTLVELLVVIIVLGILAGIAVPVFLHQRSKAIGAGVIADVRAMAQSEDTWLVDHPGSPGFNFDSRTPGVTIPAGIPVDVHVSHPDTVLYGYGRSPEGGYCIKAYNPHTFRNGTGWVQYDSLQGGLFAWRSVPAGGAC